ATWTLRWVPALRPAGVGMRETDLAVAGYLAVMLAALLVGARGRERSGLERRIVAALAPALALSSLYLAFKPATARMPIASPLLPAAGEVALLLLLRRPAQAERLPSTAKRLAIYAGLLALAALVVLVGAAESGLFPKAPVPLVVATLV